MTDPAIISEEDLHAFIDGELEAARAGEIAAVLARDHALAARVAAFRADKEELARVYGPLIDKPVPLPWQAMIARGGRGLPPLMPRTAWMALAASIVAALVGWASLTYLRPVPGDSIVAEAIAARDDGARAAVTVAAASASQALAQALDLNLQAPDLSKMGYTLASVSTYADAPGGGAVKLDYRDAQARAFTIYLRRSLGEVRFEMLRQGETRICVWQDDVVGAVMLGEMSAGEMLRLASLAYAGFGV
jgi:anti-sigma factor RsiW